MSKTWSTKKKILNLLSKKSMMPSEIGAALGIAPSTVTEHLKALKDIGAVEELKNPYVKKWKYYKMNMDFDVKKFERGNMMSGKIVYVISAVIAIAIIAGAVLFLGQQVSSNGGVQSTTTLPQSVMQVLNTSRLSVQLTDPPVVPNGTTSLIINYSDISAHLSSGTNSSGWVNGTGSGSVNLLSIINTSQILGNVTLVKNATINMVRFYISNAWIVINNTKYNVTVPSGMITAHITSANRLGSTSSAILDLSPVIATIYTNNSTVFVMVPSVRAIVVPTGTINLHTGLKVGFSSNITNQLNDLKPNITIRSVNLIANTNNSTSIVVSVQNMGNTNVTINNIGLFGNESVIIKPNVPVDLSNEQIQSNDSSNTIVNVSSDVTHANANMPYQLNNLIKTQLKAKSSILANTSINANSIVSSNINANGVIGIGSNSINALGNIIASGNINLSVIEHEHPYAHGLGLNINGSVVNLDNVINNISNRASIENTIEIGTHLSNFRVVNFFVGSKGQLILPFGNRCDVSSNENIDANQTGDANINSSDAKISASSSSSVNSHAYISTYCLNSQYNIEGQQKGYVIPAKSSATFIFTGKISIGNGVVTVMPIIGNTYLVRVTGEEGAQASSSVVASGI